MSFSFNPSRGPVHVEADFSGPSGQNSLRLLLDTGATTNLIDIEMLITAGYDPDQSARKVDVTTGNGVVPVPLVVLNRLTALGRHRIGFPVLVRALPPDAGVDGLLGLDFLRGEILTLDFRSGRMTLA